MKIKFPKVSTKVIAICLAVALLFCGVFYYYNSGTYQYSADTAATQTTTPSTTNGLCGSDIALVIDNTTSITDQSLAKIQTALTSFVDQFSPAATTMFSVTYFNKTAVVAQKFTADKGIIKTKINSITVKGSSSSTNWNDALAKADSTFDPRSNAPNLILFITDGNPSVYGAKGASGTPFNAIRYSFSNAIAEAAIIKAKGTKIISLALGTGVTKANLVSVSGPNVYPDKPIDKDTNVIMSDFDNMTKDLTTLYTQSSSTQISIQVQLDSNGDGKVDLDGSKANSSLSGFSLKSTGTGIPVKTGDIPTLPPQTITSNSNGKATIAGPPGTYNLTQTKKTGTTLLNASCTYNKKSIGTVNLKTGTISNLTAADNQIPINCVFVNQTVQTSTNPVVPVQPSTTPIITKLSVSVIPSPMSVPIGGADVQYSYFVSNPSTVAVTNVTLSDDHCTPILFVSGDTNSDNKLDPTETWDYSCTTHVAVATTNAVTVKAVQSGQTLTSQTSTTVTVIPAGPPVTGKAPFYVIIGDYLAEIWSKINK